MPKATSRASTTSRCSPPWPRPWKRSPDFVDPARLPIAIELFAQWRRARGNQQDTATRPYSRDWEELLSAAGLFSATERSDAERDARALESAGWLELKSVR